MTEHHDPNLVDYAVGVLDAAGARVTEAHLAECTHCRQELQQLRDIDTALRALPPELFIDGPPHGGELALRRAVKQIGNEKTRPVSAPRLQRMLLIAAAAIVLALVAGGSWVLGAQAGLSRVTGQALPADGTRIVAPRPPGLSSGR